MNKITSMLLISLMSFTMSAAQVPEADIEAAIKSGLAGKVGGLFASCSVGAGFLQEVAIGSTSGNTGTVPTGKYHIQLSTNLGMIAMAASEAKKIYKPYGRSDVTDELLQPAVYVSIFPSDPVETKNALGVVLQLGVAPPLSHVVLKSKDGAAIQPQKLEVTPVPWNRGGSTVKSTRADATFAIDAVTALAAGDFNIIVVTEAGERKCKVDKGDRKRLRLDQPIAFSGDKVKAEPAKQNSETKENVAKQGPEAKVEASKQLTVDQIIKMVEAKVSDDMIISTIQKSGSKFDLTPEVLIKLKTAGVSDAVIRTMNK